MAYIDEIRKAQQEDLAECYEIQAGETKYFYTSHDEAISFQSHDFVPAPLKRNQYTQDTQLKAGRIKLSAPLSGPLQDYIANTPIEPTTVKIYIVVKNNPAFFRKIFDGEIIGITMTSGFAADVDCESRSKVLRKKLPAIVHQAYCNNRLFDGVCQVNKASYKRDITGITIDGSDIVHPDLLEYDNYFTLGHAITSYNDARLITNHVDDRITLNVPFDSRIATGGSLTVYPGCEKSPDICQIKFNNFSNFVGFPFIPSKNPVIWGI